MEAGTAGDTINPWARRAVPDARDGRAADGTPSSPPTTNGSIRPPTREQARNDRLHGADGVIPTPLWIVLFFIAAVIFVFMLFFADSGERAVVQGC